MLLRKIFNLKYTKRILVMFLATILMVIVLETGILIPGQAPVLNLASVDILKISAPDPLEPPQECLAQPADGYNASWACFRPYFERITNEVSVNAAMAEARRFKAQKMVSDCHLFAHSIGETALEKYDYDIGKSFSSCTSGCINGCFHGVMERYLRNEADLSNLSPKIKNVCDVLGTDPLSKFRCIHGVGHGLFAHDYLPLQDAVNVCDAFESDQWTDFCIGGLTMENMDQYLLLDLDEDHLRRIIPEICAQIESVEPGIMYPCIFHVSLGLLYYTGYDIERSGKLCEELIQQKYIDLCKEFFRVLIPTQAPSNIDIEKFLKAKSYKEFK